MAGRYGTGIPLYLPTTQLQHYRRPHLQTSRRETLPTRSEEEQPVVRICRPNSKITSFSDVYLIYVLCSLLLYAQVLNF
jgi:hypothetical protein